MTALRNRMIDDLQLAGMAESTQREYVRAVRQLAEHYMKSPTEIGEEEIRQYFLYLKNVKKWARPTIMANAAAPPRCRIRSASSNTESVSCQFFIAC